MMQGKQNLWTALREAAPVYNLAGLTLHVSIPRLHESFYANWKRRNAPVVDDAWRMTLPLTLRGQVIGKLQLWGGSAGQQALVDMRQLFDFLESLDAEIETMADDDGTVRELVAVGAAGDSGVQAAAATAANLPQ